MFLHIFTFKVVDGQELFIEFYDDDNKDDEFLGRAKIQTSLVAMRGHIGKKVVVHCFQLTQPLFRELLGEPGRHRPGVSSGIFPLFKLSRRWFSTSLALAHLASRYRRPRGCEGVCKARKRGRHRRQGTRRTFEMMILFKLSRIWRLCYRRVTFSKLTCVQQQNGDGSKVTPSLKGLADVTVVNIQCFCSFPQIK